MKWLASVSILLLIQGVQAQQIYKSVDKNGKVSYSSQPVKGAVKVDTVAPPPPPSQQEVERAQQRYLELEARDAEREEKRREQEQENLRQRQIREDLELKRKIANRKPANVIVINQNPYYWGSNQNPYDWGGASQPLWQDPTITKLLPAPEKPVARKPFGPVDGPLYHRSDIGGGLRGNSNRHGRH